MRLRNNVLKRFVLKGKTEETLLLYVKQRNKCMFLPRKFKRRYEGLDDNRGIGNKTFRKIIKPPLSEKSNKRCNKFD